MIKNCSLANNFKRSHDCIWAHIINKQAFLKNNNNNPKTQTLYTISIKKIYSKLEYMKNSHQKHSRSTVYTTIQKARSSRMICCVMDSPDYLALKHTQKGPGRQTIHI